ncbi:ParB/RepB/Spo0J family partition protein [Roseovarius sp. EL26]|uniref:ParB/RepB/Spo0J family partition protein n=1 Tax=Roseovarius sp. EL26 TaxID=2126672 RepID=UPI000EA3CDE2|nr:ParB/RepB/Spo0J family partition protein [Roseovarius sp. EL26]
MAKKTKQRGLGRGLSALMADVSEDNNNNTSDPKSPDILVPIEKVQPNPDQPRRIFDEEKLQELASSIREKGVIQPLIVRKHPELEDNYEIVAGERRWRASQIAQRHNIPVLVREFTNTEVLEVAIIENVQRADLNAMDEALGYNQLMDKFGHTQEKLAEVLGKSRSHIANSVRLLNLPNEVQTYVREDRLSAGHARALIPAGDPASLARQIIKKGLSVRDAEKIAKSAQAEGAVKKARLKTQPTKDADTKALEGDLTANLGMKVSLNHKPGQEKGQLVISYDSFDQLDTICGILSKSH